MFWHFLESREECVLGNVSSFHSMEDKLKFCNHTPKLPVKKLSF
jgi:hypothetical protein